MIMFLNNKKSFSKLYVFVFNLIKIVTIVFIFRMSLLIFVNAENFGVSLLLCTLFELIFLLIICFFAKHIELACKIPPSSILNLAFYIYHFFLINALFGTSYVGTFYIVLSPIYFFVENINMLFYHPLWNYDIYNGIFSLIFAILFISVLCLKTFKYVVRTNQKKPLQK